MGADQSCTCFGGRSEKGTFGTIPEPQPERAEDEASRLPSKYNSDIGESKAAFVAGFVHERSIRMLRETYDVDAGITLGRGAYGNVTAVRRKIDGEQFALKMIKIGAESDATFEEIRNEIAIQKRLDHPNIAKIYESYEDKRAPTPRPSPAPRPRPASQSR